MLLQNKKNKMFCGLFLFLANIRTFAMYSTIYLREGKLGYKF